MSTRFPLTPGAYLKHRRTAAGLDLFAVAERLETEPRLAQHVRADWLRLIEADAMPASFATIVALRSVIPFDLAVLERLILIQNGADQEMPRLCRICSCCDSACCYSTARGPCWWVEEDLCSQCADPAIVAGMVATNDRVVIPELIAATRPRHPPVFDFSLPPHTDAAA